MPDINKANRQVCDLLICDLKTKVPFMKFDTANTTTVGLNADSVHAMAKGARRISFQNPLDGTLGVECQLLPSRFYAMFSDGTIDTTAVYADTQTIACDTAGKLTLKLPTTGTVVTGTVFAYPEDSYGDDSALIEGSFAAGAFTATSAEKIAVGKKYTIGYVISRTGVKKVAFNNKKMPKDYYITMSTVEKDEDGVLTPFKIVAYKATIQRNFELSFSSEGDPMSVSATFDLSEDKEGNFVDMIEIPDAE